MSKLFFIIIICFINIHLFAQHEGIERHFKSYKLKGGYYIQDKTYYKDTTTNNLFNFMPQYNLSKHLFGFLNPGTPIQTMLFSDRVPEHKFFFFSNYYPYINHHKNTIYFDAQKPFTFFTFTGGANNMELVNFFHTQNINPYFNFGLDINVINSDGHYMNNQVNINTVSLFTSYTKKRYQSHSSFIFNKLNHFENGGIASDSIFENSDIRTENLDVNLMNAQNNLHQIGLQYNQEYRFGNFVLDTIVSEDKNDTVYTYNYIGKLSVIQNLKADKYYRIYSDIPSDFYENIFLDSLNTFDSTGLKNFEHGLFINFNLIDTNDKKTKLKIMGGIKSDLYIYNFDTLDNFYQYHYLSGNLLFENRKHFLLSNFDYCFAGFGIYDMKINAKHNYQISNNIKIHSLLNYEYKNPDIILYNYKSNHFKWDNEFNKSLNIRGKTALNIEKINLEIGANFNFINNYIIFDFSALPTQIESSNIITDVYIGKLFSFGNFYWDNKISWQKVQNKNLLPLPEYLAYTSLYYKTPLFNNAAVLQTGLSSRYHGESYAYAYMPATGLFYLQNSKKTGNYYMLSYHISVQVKRLRGFIKVSNFNTMFMPRNYYLMYNTPDNPFAINFGILWEFYN